MPLSAGHAGQSRQPVPRIGCSLRARYRRCRAAVVVVAPSLSLVSVASLDSRPAIPRCRWSDANPLISHRLLTIASVCVCAGHICVWWWCGVRVFALVSRVRTVSAHCACAFAVCRGRLSHRRMSARVWACIARFASRVPRRSRIASSVCCVSHRRRSEGVGGFPLGVGP